MEEFRTNCESFFSLGNDHSKIGQQNKNSSPTNFYSKINQIQMPETSYVEPFFLNPTQELPIPGTFYEDIDPIEDAEIYELQKKIESSNAIEPPIVPQCETSVDSWD